METELYINHHANMEEYNHSEQFTSFDSTKMDSTKIKRFIARIDLTKDDSIEQMPDLIDLTNDNEQIPDRIELQTPFTIEPIEQ